MSLMLSYVKILCWIWFISPTMSGDWPRNMNMCVDKSKTLFKTELEVLVHIFLKNLFPQRQYLYPTLILMWFRQLLWKAPTSPMPAAITAASTSCIIIRTSICPYFKSVLQGFEKLVCLKFNHLFHKTLTGFQILACRQFAG